MSTAKSVTKRNNIVLATGCFDIVHAGHIWLLLASRKFAKGCRLVVGINSDASVRRLKGKNRPINCEYFRKFLLENIKCVDEVIVFEENDPCKLIKKLRPKYFVKGSEYLNQNIPEKPLCKFLGTKIIYVDPLGRLSTTGILKSVSKRKTR